MPWLLRSFAKWLSTQAYGAVGCFSIDAKVVPDENALVFATLPNDRQLAIDVGTGAVMLRWANGVKKREISKSLVAFLVALSESNLGVIALDVGDGSARAELATWLKITTPAARSQGQEIGTLTGAGLRVVASGGPSPS